MVSVIPQLSRVWRNSFKFLQFSVPFQNSDSVHLQPEVSRQLKFAVLGFLSLNPSGKHSVCTLHLSRFYSHYKSASTNIVTFHSPNAHSQDVLKCQMLNGTKKHFSTFLLMSNRREKAEIALTSVDLLDLNTPFIWQQEPLAVQQLLQSLQQSTREWSRFCGILIPARSIPRRAVGARWLQEGDPAERSGQAGNAPAGRGSRGEAVAIVCLLPLLYRQGKHRWRRRGWSSHPGTVGFSCPIRTSSWQGALLSHSSGSDTGSFPVCLVLFLMLLKTASWQYSFCTFEFTQKTQLSQKCWDNMIFSCFWLGNWIFWHIKRLQNEKKNQSFVLIYLYFLREQRARESRH